VHRDAGSRRSRLPEAVLCGAALAAVLSGCFTSGAQAGKEIAVVDGDPIVQMTPAEKLPALDHPYLTTLSRHTDPPAPWEPVVGIPLERASRSYPLGLLDRYEVVNDRADGLDYVVTRCPLAQVAAVYDRRVGGQTLTFVNSGALWRDTLVIQDRETGTLWTVATGRALYGPLQGESLRPIPAVLATARAWKESYPDARYLDTGETSETPLTLSLYAVSSWQGLGTHKTSDKRFEPKATLYSVSVGSEALAFTEDDLKGLGCIAAWLGGRAIRLEWDAGNDCPRAYGGEEGLAEELAVVPMYWFALDRHFETVRTLAEAGRARP